MTRIVWMEPAISDLNGLHAYIARDAEVYVVRSHGWPLMMLTTTEPAMGAGAAPMDWWTVRHARRAGGVNRALQRESGGAAL